ncbi:DUF4328 domain-containing protein [Nonomuraea sp. NEAU-A123]|uniref:DUF4328 domain-containing protein n=1 Tax=Nonomuraea sp. NEAU-A123 TaxID=2839649 RepID=UPI001BE4B9A7|nr:DUF4328 domain-containing protein [Nonomuraea sp. NEAU-A123]MBT2233413.1 DUF4328 domain-containing protein [Nonomuraea sp. NEAU-A123]
MYSPPFTPSPPLRPVRVLANVALGALAFDCLTGLAVAVIDLREVSIINRLISDPDSVSDAEIDSSDTIYAASGYVETAVFLLAGIAFLMWMFRVRANADLLAPGEQRHRKLWVIFGWIAPILALWFPKQIIDDIWDASRRIDQPSRSGLIIAWWTAWLLSSWVSQVVGRLLVKADDLEGMAAAAKFDVVSLAMWVVAAALAAAVILRITNAQETRRLAPSVQPA